MGSVDYAFIADFTKSLESSFIKEDPKADGRYSPHVLTNEKETGNNVLSALKSELRDCTSFDFSVAFITPGGVTTLLEMLSELARRKVPGRVLTSTYLNFTDPEALRSISGYPNIECRVYQGNLHAKGYFFDRNGLSTMIIGSSNLTDRALTDNKEWNVLFRSTENGELFKEAQDAFEVLWNDDSTVAADSEWIDAYETVWLKRKRPSSDYREAFSIEHEEVVSGDSETIHPNEMQREALEHLQELHISGANRALLVSATGTGKTYLSAFDVKAVKPHRVLFIAHRQRILSASQKSFERVLGKAYSYELYAGGSSRPKSSCVFAMVTTLSNHLDEFAPDEFDYIVIDEAHRTGAMSYQKILAYFTPEFCLGMTATPNRTDGYDVFNLFNNTIAHWITLQDALENDMLVPFHYFGIADLEIDDETVDDVSLFGKLTSEERVRHITKKIEEYTVKKNDRRGLIFCNRNDEARKLSEMFNARGYRTLAISGATSDEDRNEAIARLESGELQYLFSVDILNEGVDIPSLNQIIMLRRTESAIVFVQQLGRGLRKDPGKDYTLVLDFIGNYQQNYLVPIALSGDRSYNKDNLRKVVKEGDSLIPGASTISFDRISEARIFKSLEDGKFSEAKRIKSEYQHLKQILGRIPRLVEFDENNAFDPLIIIKKYGSYPAFLQQYDSDCGFAFSDSKLDILKFLSQKFAHGKRRGDLVILKGLISKTDSKASEHVPHSRVAAKQMHSIELMLSGKFSTSGVDLVESHGDEFSLSSSFAKALQDDAFRRCVMDVIDFALKRNKKDYSETYKDTDFVLGKKYTREEVCRFLHWEKEPNMQNIGGYFYDKVTNTFPVFINYEKDASKLSVTTMYEDRFISDRELIAISKSNRTTNSPEIQRLANAEENGVRCFLFMRKNTNDKDDGNEFYFLGEMHPTGRFKQFTMKGSTKKAVEITYRLEDPVQANLYDYFRSDFSEGMGSERE